MGLTVEHIEKLLRALVGDDQRRVEVVGQNVVIHTRSPGRYIGRRGTTIEDIISKLAWISSAAVEVSIAEISDGGPGDPARDREPRRPGPPSPHEALARPLPSTDSRRRLGAAASDERTAAIGDRLTPYR